MCRNIIPLISGSTVRGSALANQGTPSAGTAEVIVDITSTGATLKANHLKILGDGIILKSQANLVASNTADWSGGAGATREKIARLLQVK